jgi:hypothetical protein
MKERYLMACRLLKSASLKKGKRHSHVNRKKLLQGLTKNRFAPSEAHASAIESASHTLLSDPPLQFGSAATDIHHQPTLLKPPGTSS